MSIDPQVVDDLQRMMRDGTTPSRLIRHIMAHHADDSSRDFRIRVLDYFHEAFRVFLRGLPRETEDWSNEYSNPHHNQFLLHHIVQHRAHWDQSGDCAWLGDLKATDQGALNDSIDLNQQPEFAGVVDHLDETAEKAIKSIMGSANALYELVQVLAALAERLQQKVDRLEEQMDHRAEPVSAGQQPLN